MWRNELSDPSTIFPIWLTEWMEVHKITLWGAADLRDFSTPQDETGQGKLLSVSQGAQLRNLLSSLSLWIKSVEKEV
jgi:hypothetical protein